MKQNIWALIVVLASCSVKAQVAFTVSGTKQKKLGLVVGLIQGGNADALELEEVGKTVLKDCGFTNQFQVKMHTYSTSPDKKTIQRLYTNSDKQLGAKPACAVFINRSPDQTGYEWRLFDTMTGSMLAGKKYHTKGTTSRAWGHAIADAVWPVLTGRPGIFSTKIAYCKQIKLSDEKAVKHIYIADYDGSHAQRLVESNTINLAPRWNHDVSHPLLFYSAYTNENVRLMVSDMGKKNQIASNFAGINMLPSFSADGKKLVYCVSRGDGNCQLYYYDQHNFKRLTSNRGHNICPALSGDGATVFFCSDFKKRTPQIFAYDMATQELEAITTRGFAVCPRYHDASKRLAYCKTVNGIMQLFVYDTTTKEHTQITFSDGNKEECSWSTCGNYLLCAVESGKSSRLALVSLVDKNMRCITSANEHCSYPDWSPVYQQYPVVCA